VPPAPPVGAAARQAAGAPANPDPPAPVLSHTKVDVATTTTNGAERQPAPAADPSTPQSSPRSQPPSSPSAFALPQSPAVKDTSALLAAIVTPGDLIKLPIQSAADAAAAAAVATAKEYLNLIDAQIVASRTLYSSLVPLFELLGAALPPATAMLEVARTYLSRTGQHQLEARAKIAAFMVEILGVDSETVIAALDKLRD
jgi:hypothetical protein